MIRLAEGGVADRKDRLAVVEIHIASPSDADSDGPAIAARNSIHPRKIRQGRVEDVLTVKDYLLPPLTLTPPA
jgi:hypothetical protein